MNQPKLSPSTTWNPNGTTLADNFTIGSQPSIVYVSSKNNTVYVTGQSPPIAVAWINGGPTPTRNTSTVGDPWSIFGANNGDIYISCEYSDWALIKWNGNGTLTVAVPNVTDRCYGMFIDDLDDIYCSIFLQNLVRKFTLVNGTSISQVIAGNGTMGNTSDLLSFPLGIIGDTRRNLYVVDYYNTRIQRFRPGSLIATTLAGTGAPGTITLFQPQAVVLDADGYLFIADSANNRIVGSGPFGFYCVAGCSNLVGPAADRLNYPTSLSFDSYGNLYVIDTYNFRVQKFMLTTNSCGE